MKSESYAPQKRTSEILDRAYELVQSVPYQVSARWLFYRLLQEGYYKTKDDYKNKFLPAISSARHAFYNHWRPDTLADETRTAETRGEGFLTAGDWLRAIQSGGFECVLDKWQTQSHYVELWFEARAMLDQFRHYTEYITLRPMGGQPSIPYKWKTAKDLERRAKLYGKPIMVLYFGDLDTAGARIAQVVKDDVSKWCAAPFEFIYCGLTLEQVQRYNVPENFEKPGDYQWEALPDSAASDIIKTHAEPFISHGGFSTICDLETRAAAWLRDQLVELTPPDYLIA